MKHLSFKNMVKYAMVALIGGAFLASCDQTLHSSFVKKVQNGPNLALFHSVKKSATQISDGTAYKIPINVEVAGPHMKDVSGDITIKIQPSTKGIKVDTIKNVKPAQEGLNFSIPTSTMTLKESNNYRGQFFIEMLTQGITAPLDLTPKLKLNIVSASGNPSVINSGKPITVTLNYACPSQMQGVYTVTGTAYFGTIAPHTAKVFQDGGLGQYVTNSIGGWYAGGSRTGSLAPLSFGVKFADVCGTITVKSTNLGGYYSNAVTAIGQTAAHPKVGAQDGSLDYFTLKYNVDGLGDYSVKYTRVGSLPASAAASHQSRVSEASANASVPSHRVAKPLNINNH